jgi:CPA1 family monovalent cation:H+ antiporter
VGANLRKENFRFLAFCAILATLVVQGTTLGWVIRQLGAEEKETPLPEPETAQARAEIAAAARDAIKEHVDSDPATEHAEAAAEVVSEYEARVERANIEGQSTESAAEQLHAQQRLRLVVIEAAREKLKEQVDTVDTETQRALGEELDLERQQIRRALGEA